MLTLRISPALLLGPLLILLGATAGAQWTSDAVTNTSLADRGSDQSQPKVSATPDGGCWVSWFDGIGTGWNVVIQKLDIGGGEEFSHSGILVADRSFSSTQDYGLDTDSTGNALLAYRDDGGTGVQVGVAKVALDGTVLWKIRLTNTTAFIASPKVCGLANGGVVVAWTQGSNTNVVWLDADGNMTGANASLAPSGGSFSVNDIHDTGTDAILSFTHQTGGFGSPRRIMAQKYSSSGAPLWGPNPISVFSTGSLQFGNFPGFVTDDSGGAVFSWYDTASFQLQCYVQRILSNGTPAFALNGEAVSTNTTRVRVSPSAAFDAATGDTFVFWTEQDAAQSQSSVYGQRLNSTGTRLWGDQGVPVMPVSSDSHTQVRTLVNESGAGSGALVCWNLSPSFGTDVYEGALLDGNGITTAGPFDVASTPSSKSRLAMARTTSGTAALAWKDSRVDNGDIFTQNVNQDGTLGARWTNLGGASPNGANGSPQLSAFGPLEAGSPVGLNLTGGPSGQICLLWISLNPTPANFFGGVLNSFPYNSQLVLGTNSTGGIAGQTAFPAGFPPGFNLWFQFLMQDLSTLSGITLSNTLKATTP
jgi:hypothetical protein